MTSTHPTAVVTGLGFVTCLGANRRDVVTSLRHLRSGLARWSPLPGLELPVKVAGLIPGFDLSSLNPAAWTWPESVDIHPSEVRAMPPQGVHALAALRMALAEAGLPEFSLGTGDTGLYCASGGSPRMMHHRLSMLEKSGWTHPHPHSVVGSIAGSLNFHLAALLRIRGSSCGFVSACASGSHALGFAADEIRLGRQQRMLVVAAEELTPETVLPFAGMGALSPCADPATASRPFDAHRDGFVPTGGSVAFVLESAASARQRGARIQAVVSGWGQACDGLHAASPDPEGAGLLRAMRLALRDAGLTPEDVDHVNAHATSTPAGDKAEARALRTLFQSHQPAICSTKALTGHGLSMAGLMEAAFGVLSLDHGFIPGQANLRQPDEACAGLFFPPASLDQKPRVVMNNSSGFGGANVVHLLSRTPYE
jgi:3-oxoacyl-[acyl-carrier-protein] synthase-1